MVAGCGLAGVGAVDVVAAGAVVAGRAVVDPAVAVAVCVTVCTTVDPDPDAWVVAVAAPSSLPQLERANVATTRSAARPLMGIDMARQDRKRVDTMRHA